MTATTIPAPIFFTVPAQDHLLFNFKKNKIAEYFNVIDGGDTPCSDIEIAHYVSLLFCPPSTALTDDAGKYRVGNLFFESIASHLCKSYGEESEFKRYVSLFRFTAKC
jgi:hypothetical protein